jgi:hypothetical protein
MDELLLADVLFFATDFAMLLPRRLGAPAFSAGFKSSKNVKRYHCGVSNATP